MSAPSTPQPTRPRRRWCQFSLRGLLVLIAIAAIPLLGVRLYLVRFGEQRRTMDLIEELGGTYETELGVKGLR